VTLTAAASLTPNTYNLTIRGTGPAALRAPGGGLVSVEATTTLAVTVTAAAASNFSLSTTPSGSASVTQGAGASVTINVARTVGLTIAVAASGGGGSGNVSIDVSGCGANTPVWAAFQNGDFSAPWQVVTPVNGVYSFSISAGRGGFTSVTTGTGASVVSVQYL